MVDKFVQTLQLRAVSSSQQTTVYDAARSQHLCSFAGPDPAAFLHLFASFRSANRKQLSVFALLSNQDSSSSSSAHASALKYARTAAAAGELLRIPQAAAQVDLWPRTALVQGSWRHLGISPVHRAQAGPHPVLFWPAQVCHPLGLPRLLLHAGAPLHLHPRGVYLTSVSPFLLCAPFPSFQAQVNAAELWCCAGRILAAAAPAKEGGNTDSQNQSPEVHVPFCCLLVSQPWSGWASVTVQLALMLLLEAHRLPAS